MSDKEVWLLYDQLILEQARLKLRAVNDILRVRVKEPIPQTPPRLAVLPTCDRSKPPFLFAIYDEHGEVVIDDC